MGFAVDEQLEELCSLPVIIKPMDQTLLTNVSFTERELEVLHLKAKRRTNAEIAEQLFLSITPVKWYVRQIYNKLGVNNRSQAVAVAQQLGLLDKKPEKAKRPSPPPPASPRP